jgi:N-methylhydantoinase A
MSTKLRFSCDTGGTFTDLLVESADDLRMYKTNTVVGDPAQSVLNVLAIAAADRDLTLEDLLVQGTIFIHGTTQAINAIIAGSTAKTAFLTTEGHPDILVIREGGRREPFDHKTAYPEPYIPRSLTFEVPERIDYAGAIMRPLDEAVVLRIIEQLRALEVEAVAVCLLWSIVNPAHEARVGALLEQHMPGVAVTLSHALNPTLREYRRASATAIDASLKPLMSRYLGRVEGLLRTAGFAGRVLTLTSQGGTMDAAELARMPIHAVNSGPSMAPIGGRYYARLEGLRQDIIVADTGGTTYDVSLVRGDVIPWTRETWIGAPYSGHITGFPSIDVKSIGAGGGSIAWVDSGGMLHVGPMSAGSEPGPVAYGAGGTEPTLTDACVVLGYIDPDYFLGGSITLDRDTAREAIRMCVGEPLGLEVETAANAIVDLATQNMVQAIADITVNQGIDATKAVLIGGGGGGGLNSDLIARRLGCNLLLFPDIGAGLSAGGALVSDLTGEFRATLPARSEAFDFTAANAVLARLSEECEAYLRGPGSGSISHEISFAVEARYPSQVWDVEVPVPDGRVADAAAVASLVEGFHENHRRLFAIDDPDSPIEITGWIARIRCTLRDRELPRLASKPDARACGRRLARFAGPGWVETPIYRFADLEPETPHRGPAIVESPFTTIVLQPGSRFHATRAGGILVDVSRANRESM